MILSVISLLKKSANWRTLFLIVFGITYLVIGALIFKSVENAYETQMRSRLFAQEAELKLKYNISENDYDNMTITTLELEPHRAGVQWGFTGAVYFAITVVTTIGYGHSVPQTTAGKILCIFYAIIGIPLWLVTFQAMGERINTGAKYLFKIIGHRMGFKFDVVSHKCLIPFGILSCMLTLLVGTIAFAHFENWSYINSAYFCVMTLSTIGFGDYVALQKGKSIKDWPQYVSFTLIYIMIGLTVIGAFLNLVILRMMVTLPATPEHSVNGGSKKNSPERSRNLSITSRRSQFDDDERSIEEGDTTSRKCMKVCCEENCCLERETCLRNHKCNQIRNEIIVSSSDACATRNEGFWIPYGYYEHSKRKNDICMNCKLHMCELCDECRSMVLHCCNCWINCCAICPCMQDIGHRRNSQYDNAPSSSSENHCDLSFLNHSSQNYLQNENVKSNGSLSYLPNASEGNTSIENKASIPEVTVSHIKVSLAESCSSSNNNSNSINFAADSSAPSHFLSPSDCLMRRNRFGSGDSGYLGGARSSSSNISHHIDDDSVKVRERADSKSDFEIGTRPYSLPSNFDQLNASQAFPNKGFKILNKNGSFPIFQKDTTNPNEFKRKSFENLQSLENDEKQTRKKRLKREASINYHSDTEIIYNRSDEVISRDQNIVVKTQRTKILPLSIEDRKQDHKSETSSLKGIYKRVTSKKRKKRKCSSSLSHQDSNETAISILNSGDWDDHVGTTSHMSVLETVVDVYEASKKAGSLTTPDDLLQNTPKHSSNHVADRCQRNHISNNTSSEESTIFRRKIRRRCHSEPLIQSSCYKRCCALNRCCRYSYFQSLHCHLQSFHQNHIHPPCCHNIRLPHGCKCAAFHKNQRPCKRNDGASLHQQNSNPSTSSKNFLKTSSSFKKCRNDKKHADIRPSCSTSFTDHLPSKSYYGTEQHLTQILDQTGLEDALDNDVFHTTQMLSRTQLYKSETELVNRSQHQLPC